MIDSFHDSDMSQTACLQWKIMPALTRFRIRTTAIRPTVLLQGVSMLALAAGVGVWSALLLAPAAQTPPPGLTVAASVRGDTAPIAQWFGASVAPLRIVLVGLIASETRAAALLRVEGGAPVAYRVGQQIGPGVTLLRVERDAVVLDTGGSEMRIAATAAAPLGSPGFVPIKPGPKLAP